MEISRGPPRIKNKQAAPIQISAEQLLREAVDRQDSKTALPTHKFADLEELHEYQGRKRKEFEDYVRRNRINIHNWLRYAAWEIEQKDFRRARSVFERALDVDSTNIIVWLRYIESEMKNRNINHTRNLLDRAVTIMPRVDKFWYKYVYMEETLANVAGTRQVFERWMTWEPDEAAWGAYIKLEKRYGEYERARAVFGRFTAVHPDARNWVKWARFEEENGTSDLVRDVFGAGIEALGDDFMDERLVIAYAKFETRLKEYERARAIYKFALDRLSRAQSINLHKAYTQFEKQFGDQEGIEDVVIAKRRVQYQEQLRDNPSNYDIWFDFVRLEESAGDVDRAREVYEQAIAQLPPTTEKRHWRRYIYLWIFYALWEETNNKEVARARQIYDECLNLIPHKTFTFAKIWLLKAQFEIRQGQLGAARKTLGRAIGMCPKDKLFKGYIDLEMKLFEFGRCRTLYEKHLEWNPANATGWIRFAELEAGLDDIDRARAIFDLAITQDELDMPELAWKAYIDFEEVEREFGNARKLYERLLQKTNHVKVWISYALFEINIREDEADEDEVEEAEERQVSAEAKSRTRRIFERAHKSMKDGDLKEERVAILHAWESFEQAHGTAQDVASIRAQLPRRVKRRRKIGPAADGTTTAAGADTQFEEYIDYVFPADHQAAAAGLSKLQQKALEWKAKQAAAAKAARHADRMEDSGSEQPSSDDDGSASPRSGRSSRSSSRSRSISRSVSRSGSESRSRSQSRSASPAPRSRSRGHSRCSSSSRRSTVSSPLHSRPHSLDSRSRSNSHSPVQQPPRPVSSTPGSPASAHEAS